MKIYELLQFNKEFLKRLCFAGIKPEDYRYADLFADYERLSREGEKKTYIVGRQIRDQRTEGLFCYQLFKPGT